MHLKDQRIVFVGFGSAGVGIANLLVSVMQDEGLSEQQARARFYALDIPGLLVEGVTGLRSEQTVFARTQEEVKNWQVADQTNISLLEVVRNAKTTVLIGVSGQPGVFTEEAVREMTKNTQRPTIFPLSNPTSRSEATPQQLLDWTQGRALIGTGSPFPPVKVNGRHVFIDQTNNSYIFPGLALGIISSRAQRVSDGMIKAAAKALAELSPTRRDKDASLLPPLETLRSVSRHVAEAVGEQAIRGGLTQVNETEFEHELAVNVWEPQYMPYELVAE